MMCMVCDLPVCVCVNVNMCEIWVEKGNLSV